MAASSGHYLIYHHIMRMEGGRRIGKVLVALEKQESQEDERYQDGKENQEPGKARSPRAAYEVEYPRPEKNVKDLDQKQHADAAHLTTVGS